MRKILAFILTFFIIFAPVYSNAVLPALAASAASAGGRVLVGQAIKKLSSSALAAARKASIGICTKNPAICKTVGLGTGGLIGALVGDGWNIEVNDNSTTNNIDVDIFKINEPITGCRFITYLSLHANSGIKYNLGNIFPAGLAVSKAAAIQSYPSATNFSVGSPDQITAGYNTLVAYVKTLSLTSYQENVPSGYGSFSQKVDFNYKSGTPLKDYPQTTSFSGNYVFMKTCAPENAPKIYINNDELNQYINNNQLDGDDILNIYNYDYSQHPTINIAGNEYNGTTVNNDLAKSDSSEADKKVTQDIKQKVESGQLSLDDINDENCTKNEVGEYDKCGAEEPEQCPVDTVLVDGRCVTTDEQPAICSSTELTQKFCNWIDWTQEEPMREVGTEVDIVEAEPIELDRDLITLNQSCPANTSFSISLMGATYAFEIDNRPACDIALMISPYIIIAGTLSAIYTYAGIGRSNSEID